MVSFWWLPVRTKLSLRKKALSFWSEFFQWLSSPVEEQVWRRFLKSGLLRLSYGSQHKSLLKSFWIFRNFRNPTWYTANIRWGQGPLIHSGWLVYLFILLLFHPVNVGDYIQAVLDRNLAENISRVLYPNDNVSDQACFLGGNRSSLFWKHLFRALILILCLQCKIISSWIV